MKLLKKMVSEAIRTAALKLFTLLISHSASDVTYLRGRTNFGDSIEDEWVIVYLLRELTKKHQDLWVRVVDSDGEFLLVEAASSLPDWLEPEVADYRVIHSSSKF